MLKRCNDALKVACALALAFAMTPTSAFAAGAGSQDETAGAADVATSEAMVGTQLDSSELLKTDVSKLAGLSGEAADAVEGYFDARAAEVSQGTSASEDESVDLSKKVERTSDTRTAGFRQMQDDANITITDASTSVSVSKVAVRGSQLVVTAYEQTVFTYDDLADGVGGSDTAVFGTDHTITIDTAQGTPKIKSDAYDESDLDGVDTTVGSTAGSSNAAAASTAKSPDAAQPEKAARDEGAKPAIEETASATAPAGETGKAAGPSAATSADAAEDAAQSLVDQVRSALASFFGQAVSIVFPPEAQAASYSYDSNYSVDEAIAYADKYWTKYNSKYRNFNPVGGDCANFVSQCMKAGNLNQKKSGSSAWYYTDKDNYSSSWVYCPSMVNALKSRGKYYYIKKADLAKASSAAKIFPGSPVVYRNSSGTYYHAVVCTGYNSAGTPVISAHNNDRYHVPYTYAGNACATVQLTKTAPGATFETSDGSWQVGTDNKTAVLVAFSSAATAFSVPGTVKNNGKKLTVTGFKGEAFKGNTKIEEITVKGSASAIPANAFQGCTSLKKVTVGSSVKSIGSYAFDGCKKLTSIELPSSVKSVGAYAFKDCGKLKSANLGTSVTALAKGVFQKCSKLTALSGLEKVTKVDAYAFDNCKKLASLAPLSGAKSIGKRAFRNCAALSALPAFATVTSVGAEAFKNCDALAKVSGFSALESLGKGAFQGCGALTTVNLKSPVLKSIGASAFYQDAKLASATFASPVLAKIGDWAFYQDGKLSKIKFKTTHLTVKNVGYSAFTGTPAKAKVYAPKKKHKAYKTAFVTHGLSTSAKFKNY